MSGVLLTLPLSAAQVEDKPNLDLAFPLIDAWLEAQRAYEAKPGLSVGIVYEQELVWSQGYGVTDLKQKVPASPDTIYSICSISKLFTSVAIMQLWESGKLRLDDDVRSLLPWMDLKQAYDDSVPITVRGLLTHSSGLPRESEFPYWTGPDFPFPPSEELRDKLSEQETLYPASTYYQYSNLGLSLLGEIVAEVSGQSYDDYIRKHILDPLGMSDTRTFLPTELNPKQMASGYGVRNRDGKRERVPFFDAKGVAAAAGFSSSVNDMAKFAAWQFRVLNGQKELLKPSTLKEMQRVQWIDSNFNNSRGLGFDVMQTDGVIETGHGGWCPGFRSYFSIIPSRKLAVIVMYNTSGDVDVQRFTNGIHQILKKAQSIKERKSPNYNADDFVGAYDLHPWGGETYIGPWNDELLIITFPTNNPHQFERIQHADGDHFRRIRENDELGEVVRFERNRSGRVTRFWQHSNYQNKIQ